MFGVTMTPRALCQTTMEVATPEPTRARLIGTDVVSRARVSLRRSQGEVGGAWTM